MKKFFILAAAASVTLASCVKNDAFPAPEQGDLISFNAPVVSPATKAQVKYDENVPFNVFAYYSTAVAYNGAGTTTYINNKTVSYENSVWSTENPYYWPKNGTLSFAAYSPASAVTSGALVATNSTSKNLVLDYTVPTAADDQIDVLYSDWAIDQTKAKYVTLPNEDPNLLGGWTGVDIAFHHALTAVNFTVKGTADAVKAFKIKGITLGQLSNEETLTVPYATSTAVWTTAATSKATYTVLAAAADAENSKALATDGSTIKESFILIPQSLVGVNLTIDYYVASDGGWVPQQTIIPLTDAKVGENALNAWVMGTQYNYTLEFTADVIKFAPVVEADWTIVNVDGGTI